MSGSFEHSFNSRPFGSFPNGSVRFGCDGTDAGSRVPRLVAGVAPEDPPLGFGAASRFLLGNVTAVQLVVGGVQGRINYKPHINKTNNQSSDFVVVVGEEEVPEILPFILAPF